MPTARFYFDDDHHLDVKLDADASDLLAERMEKNPDPATGCIGLYDGENTMAYVLLDTVRAVEIRY